MPGEIITANTLEEGREQLRKSINPKTTALKKSQNNNTKTFRTTNARIQTTT